MVPALLFLPCFLTLPALQRKVEKQSQNIFQKMGTQTSLYLGGKGNCCNPSFPRCHSKASGILNTRTCLGLLRCMRLWWRWWVHTGGPSPSHMASTSNVSFIKTFIILYSSADIHYRMEIKVDFLLVAWLVWFLKEILKYHKASRFPLLYIWELWLPLYPAAWDLLTSTWFQVLESNIAILTPATTIFTLKATEDASSDRMWVIQFCVWGCRTEASSVWGPPNSCSGNEESHHPKSFKSINSINYRESIQNKNQIWAVLMFFT